MRVVVSLTTIPSRIPYLHKIFNTLHQQTYPIDQIYLNLPFVSKRENQSYPKLPKTIDLTNVHIIRCPDYGPITKLYPVLEYERDPNTLLITVDDDIEYSKNRIQTLVKYAKTYPSSAIGGAGFIVGPWYRFFGVIRQPETITQVSVIEGWSGCAYRRKFFDDNLIDYKDAPPESFYHDDLWISGYLSLRNIGRVVHPEYPGESRLLPNALSSSKMVCAIRFLPVIAYLQNQGAFDEEQVASYSSTISTYIFLFFFVILIIFVWFSQSTR